LYDNSTRTLHTKAVVCLQTIDLFHRVQDNTGSARSASFLLLWVPELYAPDLELIGKARSQALPARPS